MTKTSFAKFVTAVSLALTGLLFVSPAAAEDVVSLEGEVMVERTIEEDGAERTVLTKPDDVVPGDHLVFSTHYRNESGEAVENFVVTNPLPAAVALAADDSHFQVSVDGGESYAPLAALTINDPLTGARPALLADVTHIRWTLARLEPGESGSLTYNAFVR